MYLGDAYLRLPERFGLLGKGLGWMCKRMHLRVMKIYTF